MADLSQSELEARVAALRKARDSGVLIVRHGDTSTQFRSLSELEKILGSLEGELAALMGTKRKSVRYIRQDRKGF